MTPLPFKARTSSGFSLAETVIAIGIFSFAIVGVLGVLPTAYNTIRDAASSQVAGEIVGAVASELRADPEAIRTGAFASGFPRYFDERGARVTDQGAAVYEVKCSSGTADAVMVDGSALNTSLRRAALQLSQVQGDQAKVNFQVSVPLL